MKSKVVHSLSSSISQIYLSPFYTWLFLEPLSRQVIDREVGKTILWSLKEVRGPAQLRHGSEDTSGRILLCWHYSFC